MILDKASPFTWRPNTVKKEQNTTTKFQFLEFLFVEPEKLIPPPQLMNLFCFDNSGSINNNELYFSTCQEIIDKYYKEGDIFYIWNNIFEPKDYN